MADLESDSRQWRHGVDLDDVEVALGYLGSLFDAVYAAGASMLVRVDAERTVGANPARFTVAISGQLPDDHPIRHDDADLVRAVRKAVDDFDRLRIR